MSKQQTHNYSLWMLSWEKHNKQVEHLSQRNINLLKKNHNNIENGTSSVHTPKLSNFQYDNVQWTQKHHIQKTDFNCLKAFPQT